MRKRNANKFLAFKRTHRIRPASWVSYSIPLLRNVQILHHQYPRSNKLFPVSLEFRTFGFTAARGGDASISLEIQKVKWLFIGTFFVFGAPIIISILFYWMQSTGHKTGSSTTLLRFVLVAFWYVVCVLRLQTAVKIVGPGEWGTTINCMELKSRVSRT